jgi:hypothetical protein
MPSAPRSVAGGRGSDLVGLLPNLVRARYFCKGLTFTALLSAWVAACNGSSDPVSPSEVGEILTRQLDTDSITFRFSTDDPISDEDADWQQQYHEWATMRLGVSIPGKLRYNKYLNDTQMRSVTGRGCCFAEPETLSVHTLYPRDNHEVVHVYVASQIGQPTNFLSEGLAVAFQVDPVAEDFTPRWNGTPLHDLAKGFRQNGELIPIGDMLSTEAFRAYSQSISYPEAGSFAHYMIETYGLERFLAQFRGAQPGESGSNVRSRFESIYGFPVEEAEAGWHATLLTR